jgi:DMSO/TMAO reductase YedYZ molybdopterin-dependent catalytic subunit
MTGPRSLSRRDALARGGAAAAGLALMPSDSFARWVDSVAQETVVPWVERPDEGMRGNVNVLDWEQVTSWVTPTDQLFRVGHYGQPEIEETEWSLRIGGMVNNPETFTLADIRAMPHREVTMTLECAGNRGFGGFIGAVHNATWGGTPLRPVLEAAGIRDGGIEIVFWGADTGEEEIRDTAVTQNFARSMSIEDAMDPNIILCYEVNGEPLSTGNGFPLRVIAPGWYGVANVKWLERIEVRDRRFMGRFMGRDYVTLRQEELNGEQVWTESSVGRAQINSIAGRVTTDGSRHRIHGAAWGADIVQVDVRIDSGRWQRATLGEGQDDPYTWTFWHLDWNPSPGEHTITSRAIDRDGKIQPEPSDPWLTSKKTYWESNGQYSRDIVIA